MNNNPLISRYTITDIDGNLLFDSEQWPTRQNTRPPPRPKRHHPPRRIHPLDDGHIIDRLTVLIAGCLIVIAESAVIYLLSQLYRAVVR
ncbi:hypothetical protein BN873_310017 [Candidatus Competibacter denitrificans Run_A_D11]|uniref:Uncharacterized protein n=1 Tax=Candidatus Competibacter denitrificans Run_A_D11 TaxID=1400863 RepID=W6MD57_9GAMM|nr:hypothetical protein [Candidatus Competibacter denitrificans]CDI02498.1 hypothetical protein BN873_310017 [Candidatus Competibacter denitrificans Run_A_D11]HRC70490.1 hypothetical protein [Candidatus Competibacter denitrificans]